MNKKILITGATGYIGGRLVKCLEHKDYEITCLARRPEYLEKKVGNNTKIIKGDLLKPHTIEKALKNIDIAFYLVHSMASNGDFEELDREAAYNFGKAAKQNNIHTIIYLSGLGKGKDLSPHLKSRQEVGDILRSSGCNVIEFRASIIIGAGSLSFELVRSLTEKLPIMLTPKWVNNKAQPIFIDDVLKFLIAAINYESDKSHIFEIGGENVISYADIIREYARQRNLKRILIPVPLLTPYVSSLWLGLITPIYSRIGKKLIEGVKNSTILENNISNETFNIKPIGIEESIKKALEQEDNNFSNTYWADAVSSSGCTKDVCLNIKVGNRIIESQKTKVRGSLEESFLPIQRIGGKTGWYYANFLWKIRGYIDLLFKGAGLRRGRRDPENITVGDTIDWWRVERFEKNKNLTLFSEMKLPGDAWLEFEVKAKDNFTEISQSAIFYPSGLLGIIYWYSLYPIHWFIFRGMLKNIKLQIEKDLQKKEKSLIL